MAKQVPGKEEFWGLVDWYRTMVADMGITVELGTEVSANDLTALTRSSSPRASSRAIRNSGSRRRKRLSYIDVLRHKAPVGKRVAVIGAGGIGFDVSEFLAHEGDSPTENLPEWMREWGVTDPANTAAVWPRRAHSPTHPPARSRCCNARRKSTAKVWAKPQAGFTARR